MILDVLVCNALGIFLGHVFIHYFEVKDYDWMNISAFETTQGKVRRFAEQVRDSIGALEPLPGLEGLFDSIGVLEPFPGLEGLFDSIGVLEPLAGLEGLLSFFWRSR